jgi:hypothetical protein
MYLKDGDWGAAPAGAGSPGLTPWGASPSTRAALAAGGWNVPSPVQRVNPATMVDEKSLQPLMRHTTQLDEGEWDTMQSLYEKSGGRRKIGPYATPQAVTADDMQTAEMTQKQYDALSDDQRKAVDFNTLLVEARERDLKMSRNMQGADLEDYNKRVEAIFGKGGGTSSPAPNTLELLEKIQFTAPGQDIDDYLSMEAGISLDELKNFKLPDMAPVVPEQPTEQQQLESVFKGSDPFKDVAQKSDGSALLYEQLRSAANRDASVGQAIEKAGTYITSLLQDQSGRGVDLLSTYRSVAPGDVPGVVPFGWSKDLVKDRTTDADKAKEMFFQNAYAFFRDNKDPDVNQFWTQAKNYELDQADVDEVFQYIDDFSRYEERIGNKSSVNTPEQIRSIIAKMAG